MEIQSNKSSDEQHVEQLSATAPFYANVFSYLRQLPEKNQTKSVSVDSIHMFMGVSGVALALSSYQLTQDPNVLAGMGASMAAFDVVMGNKVHQADKLEENEGKTNEDVERAYNIRNNFAVWHIGVAALGLSLALTSEAINPSPVSVGITLGIAGVSLAIGLKERNDAKKMGTPENPNLTQRMGRRLLMTKFAESILTFMGLTLSEAMDNPNIAKAAAAAILGSVLGYMTAQRGEERAEAEKREQRRLSESGLGATAWIWRVEAGDVMVIDAVMPSCQ